MVPSNDPKATPPIGIDIGNSKCVVAISRSGIVDVPLNEYSSRETPTLVHFAANHRLFGTLGAHYSTSTPSSTISQIKRLVGLPSDSNESYDELLLLPYETSVDADGFVSIKVHYLGKDQTFTAVEMLAMLLGHLRRSTEKTVGSAVSECVIGVPSYFTEKQKGAYIDAALIAGWNPLELLPDGTAAAVDYRTNRKGATDRVVVAFVDIGHCDSQITVARFRGQKARVIAEACDAKLGGRDFDEVLFRYFVERIEKRNGIDVCSDVKAKARLRMACEKTKEVLSVNEEAHLVVDSLMGDVDVNEVISREDFDQMSSRLLRRIQELFREALKKAGVSSEDGMHHVELVGSGSRIPAISKALTDVIGRKTSRTLNGTECIACGCALRCEKLLNQTHKDNDHETEKARRKVPVGTSSNELITTANLSEARIKEQKLEQQDKEIEGAKEGRNNLESRMYELRNKVEGITNESERQRISVKLTQMEEWLCQEGDDKSKIVYEDKILELESVFSPNGHHGEKTQIQANTEVQAKVMVPPAPVISFTSSIIEVSPEGRDSQLPDQISPRKSKMAESSRKELSSSSGNHSSKGKNCMEHKHLQTSSSDSHSERKDQMEHISHRSSSGIDNSNLSSRSETEAKISVSLLPPRGARRERSGVAVTKKRLSSLRKKVRSVCPCRKADAKSPLRISSPNSNHKVGIPTAQGQANHNLRGNRTILNSRQ